MNAYNNESSSSSNNSGDSSGYKEVLDITLASKNPKKRSGRKKFKETRHAVYRGVRRRGSSGKWVCEVRQPNNNSRLWLGTYPTPEMAARAHDVAVLAMRGRSACLNFADSVWRLRVPESSNVKDIQKAAAEAAEAFRHTEEDVMEIEERKEVCYVDEEEVFGMPMFFDSMAEGMMVAPPQMVVGYDNVLDNVEMYIDMSLWNF
ncbi:hypothetical protein M8C21_015105 [Ambrosia artemisiifolia]|uniref:AP2/ERF domain-containing protein n=1 Tax=Ambrosia artemisiifolia TaxID=4212 RepID=A0AAD5GMS2_AMBAR|nr:hypothetical protein M8C21_015105 [Ambrosia artemisiifolia]